MITQLEKILEKLQVKLILERKAEGNDIELQSNT